MANPKKRMTSTRSGNRRSHLALSNQKLGSCPKCKAKVLSHHVCVNCGTYKGEQVINLKK
ncbi:MAG: 50S ribosomal protein L32 [Parcubacteria group bacterium]|nr:50S ribosomal protein L32 [Parcubacteria group bacterium]